LALPSDTFLKTGLRIIDGATFTSLERYLIERIRTLGTEELLTKGWILTSTTTQAAHLRYRLAEEAGEGCVAGIRVLPLSSFAGLLYSQLGMSRGRRWSPELQLSLLELVQQVPSSATAFARARNSPGFVTLLAGTFLELAEAGLGTVDLSVVVELARELRDEPLAAQVLVCFAQWWRRLEASDTPWEPLQLLRLRDRLRELQQPPDYLMTGCGSPIPVWVYGFYDFIDVNLEFVAALGEWTRLEVLIPGGTQAGLSPWHRFARRTVDEIMVRNSTAKLLSLHSTETWEAWPVALTEPAQREVEIPPVTWCRAGGTEAELVEAARQISEWLSEDPTLATHQILMAAPDIENYYLSARRIFADFGLPAAVLDFASSADHLSRSVAVLEQLYLTRGDADLLYTWFSENKDLGLHWDVDFQVLERKLRSWAVTGAGAWRRFLAVCAIRTTEPNESSASWDPLEDWWLSPSEIEFLKDFVTTWVDAPDPQRPLSAGDALPWLSRWRAWLPVQVAVEQVLSALEAIQRRGWDVRLLPADLFALVKTVIPTTEKLDQIDRHGVRFGSFMRVRGISARRVILLGLSSERFPFHPPEDALLPEEARGRIARLAYDAGCWLRTRAELRDEMRLLLLLLSSAERVHWVIPELDSQGRPAVATPWVQRIIGRLEKMQTRARLRMPPAPREQARVLLSADRARGTYLPPAWGTLLGCKPVPIDSQEQAVLQWLVDRAHSHRLELPFGLGPLRPGGARFSVGQLQHLAECPFRFWAQVRLRAEALEPTPWEGEINALERGWLVHLVLQQTVELCVQQARPVSEVRFPADEILDENRLTHLYPRWRLLSEPMRQALRREIFDLVTSYFEAVKRGECGDGLPRALEVKLRVDWPGRPGWVLSGVVDRVDMRDSESWILDYKTGANPLPSKPETSHALQAGNFPQAVLYPWMWSCKHEESRQPRFAYIYLRPEGPQEVEIPASIPPEELLEQLAEIAECGVYVPLSDDVYKNLGLERIKSCSYCTLASACRRLAEDAPATAWETFHRNAPRRSAFLVALSEKMRRK
jgi:hypothetical protein